MEKTENRAKNLKNLQKDFARETKSQIVKFAEKSQNSQISPNKISQNPQILNEISNKISQNKNQISEQNLQLFLPEKYLRVATNLLKTAKNRVFLIGLTMFRDEITQNFVDEILAAARRNLDVHVAADFMTFTFSMKNLNFGVKSLQALKNLKNFPLSYRSKSVRETADLRRDFRAAGAKFRWLGQNSHTLFIGRTHSKWLVIDDFVFTFGGVNTEKKAVVDFNDFMFFAKNKNLADILVKEHLKIEAADRAKTTSRNHREKCDFGEVLFDGGRAGRSIIYNEAKKLAGEAREILLISQYFPTGKLAKIIREKMENSGENSENNFENNLEKNFENSREKLFKNKKSDKNFAENLKNDFKNDFKNNLENSAKTSAKIYCNKVENVRGLNKFMVRLSKSALREKNLYARVKYLHAKFIIFTFADGSRKAISGSHNFVAASSRLGTREVALLTADEKIISQLLKFFRENVA